MAKLPMVAGDRKGYFMSFLNTKIEDYLFVEDNSPDVDFEYEEIFEYDYPYENNVPEDKYYSQIVDVRKEKDRYKQPYVIVYYKIFKSLSLPAYQQGYIDEIQYHKICIKYSLDSIHYKKFIAAMHDATGMIKFKTEDCIGVTEYFQLEYKNDGDIGRITNRIPVDLDDSWFDETI